MTADLDEVLAHIPDPRWMPQRVGNSVRLDGADPQLSIGYWMRRCSPTCSTPIPRHLTACTRCREATA